MKRRLINLGDALSSIAFPPLCGFGFHTALHPVSFVGFKASSMRAMTGALFFAAAYFAWRSSQPQDGDPGQPQDGDPGQEV